MAQVQKGQGTHLELLVQRYEKPLYAFAYRILQDRSAAEDAFQETFLKVYQKRYSYRPGSPFRPWLYQICLNHCRDCLRRRTRRPETALEPEIPLPDPSLGPDQLAAHAALTARIRQAIAELPQKQREVFILHYYQELPYPEIALVVGIPLGTIKSRMFHATKQLADDLRDLRE